jgi:L-lactate dehydrogenase complex protein LldF
MQSTALNFKRNVREALADQQLQDAMGFAKNGFVAKRAALVETVPQWQAIRERAREIRNHTLHHLDFYLQEYEKKVVEHGGQVHWASTVEEACGAIEAICRETGARKIAKGKSMVSEEIGLNAALERMGCEVIETDLGEYIIQLAGESPSHIIAPAIHKTKEQVSALFHDKHGGDPITDRGELVGEARRVLREQFLSADVGITGANFLIAETGQHVLVTNEGNGDLCSSVPKVHVVITSIEKVLPTLEDASSMVRLLAGSATGQQVSNYTSFYSGPRHADHLDGPEQFHVVLVDNGRTQMLGNELREMLRCIRCGACLNHCPVYGSIGGHAYGWVYPGPMGSVITPAMIGLENSIDLPNACTLNGRCAEVCPMSIPLPDLLRRHRASQWRLKLQGRRARLATAAWSWMVQRPGLYRRANAFATGILHRLGQRRGAISKLPMAGGWTASRDLPAPQAGTFMQQWQKRGRQV